MLAMEDPSKLAFFLRLKRNSPPKLKYKEPEKISDLFPDGNFMPETKSFFTLNRFLHVENTDRNLGEWI